MVWCISTVLRVHRHWQRLCSQHQQHSREGLTGVPLCLQVQSCTVQTHSQCVMLLCSWWWSTLTKRTTKWPAVTSEWRLPTWLHQVTTQSSYTAAARPVKAASSLTARVTPLLISCLIGSNQCEIRILCLVARALRGMLIALCCACR